MTDTTSIKHPSPLTSGDFTEAREPFALFAEWFAEACKSEPNDPNAMALSTIDKDGLPDVRMVLMKGYDIDGCERHRVRIVRLLLAGLRKPCGKKRKRLPGFREIT